MSLNSNELLKKFKDVLNSCVTRDQFLFTERYGELIKRKVDREYSPAEALIIKESIDFYIKKVNRLKNLIKLETGEDYGSN